MIISRTPFRISFFGGGTDYPSWYHKHGGAVLATTIDKYCYITCRYLPPFHEHRYSIVYSKMELCNALDDIKHPAVREVLRYLKVDRGIEIHTDADLPGRSGMGSSSAFTVGFLHALHALQGRMTGKQQLARESIHVEQEILREAVGSQDQVQAAYGGLNHVLFHPKGEISVRAVTVLPERMQDLESHLMLFYTGIRRTAANVASTFVHDLAQRAQHLERMKDMVEEGLSILNENRDIAEFGGLMHRAWQAKCALSSAVSNGEVDGMYARARSAGALGGKLTGAGGGGFLLLFVPPEKQEAVRRELGDFIYVPFKFDFSGSQIIHYGPEQDYSEIEKSRALQTIKPFKELKLEMIDQTAAKGALL